MLTYVNGDLFGSPAQVLVNTVNTVGVMGKGIALEFKKRYPDMFKQYKLQCDKHKLVVGKLMLWYAPDHWLLQFPTKIHWRNPSKLEYIEEGLMTFVRKYADYNIASIAFPKLGCGNGELSWDIVRPLMEKYLKNLPIDVYVYIGDGSKIEPEHKAQKEMEDFFKQNAMDLSFTGIKDCICYHTAIVPFQLNKFGEIWKVYWPYNNDLIFEGTDNSYHLSSEEVNIIWDGICAKKMDKLSNIKEESLLYELLAELGYLQIIEFQSERDSSEMEKGYQLNSGKGRVYLVCGE